MGQYRVFLRGENFILEMDGETGCFGFYTTRFVEANGTEAAELGAVELIRHDKTFEGVKNLRDNPPMIYAEEIEEIAVNEVRPNTAIHSFQWARKSRTATHEDQSTSDKVVQQATSADPLTREGSREREHESAHDGDAGGGAG
jgi:hypothetical protein